MMQEQIRFSNIISWFQQIFHIYSARPALFNISLKQDNMMKIFYFYGHFTFEIGSYFKNLISSKWVFPFEIGRINFIYFSIYFLNAI